MSLSLCDFLRNCSASIAPEIVDKLEGLYVDCKPKYNVLPKWRHFQSYATHALHATQAHCNYKRSD